MSQLSERRKNALIVNMRRIITLSLSLCYLKYCTVFIEQVGKKITVNMRECRLQIP